MCYCLMAGVDKMNPDLRDGHPFPKRLLYINGLGCYLAVVSNKVKLQGVVHAFA